MNIKKILAFSCAAACLFSMTACGKNSKKNREKVTLNI